MVMKEKTADPALPEQNPSGEKQQEPDEVWENCKGQCGYTPWCRECMLEKEKLQKEWLNREVRPDDKKE